MTKVYRITWTAEIEGSTTVEAKSLEDARELFEREDMDDVTHDSVPGLSSTFTTDDLFTEHIASEDGDDDDEE